MMLFRKNKKKNGKPEPQTSDWLRDPSSGQSNPLSQRFKTSEEQETQVFDDHQDIDHQVSAKNTASETRIFSNDTSDDVSQADRMDDPPAGWLVIVDGPGKAESLIVGYGMNNVGRDPTQRIPLDFGDTRISRTDHAMVTYDDKSRKFYVQHGGGPTLTYLRDEPLLSPQELRHGDLIKIGDTMLRFTPLCSADFDWLDLKED